MRPSIETDLDYYGRRAIEESCAAASATCPQAGASHRRMAAVYAIRMREEQSAAAALDAMLDVLDDVNDGDARDEAGCEHVGADMDTSIRYG